MVVKIGKKSYLLIFQDFPRRKAGYKGMYRSRLLSILQKHLNGTVMTDKQTYT